MKYYAVKTGYKTGVLKARTNVKQQQKVFLMLYLIALQPKKKQKLFCKVKIYGKILLKKIMQKDF